MTILGNIFLVLAAFVFYLFVSLYYFKEQPRGGDALTGYAWGILLFNLVFLGCLAVVAFAIASNGGFDWIAADKGTRFLFVAGGLLAMIITAAVSALFKGEPGNVAVAFRVFAGMVPVLIPVVLIATGAILLNDGLRAAVPMGMYKIPLMIVFGLGMLGVFAGVFTWISASNKNAQARLEGMQADQARHHQDHLNSIEACDVMKDMAHILVYTDANHDPEVREKAIAKIKSNPDWQQALVRLLENKGAYEAFNFLASNEVEDKTLFLVPVHTGVLSVADWIRRQIREATQSYFFYPDQFSWEVERILRTVDKFEGMGMDYRPAVLELQAALNEPSEIKKASFECESLVDKWLKKR